MTTVLLALTLALAPQASRPEIADGIRQVDEGDLEAAAVTLQAALARLAVENGPERTRALGYLYLGMAQLGLDQREPARESLRQAFSLNRGARLDARRFPPHLVALYEEVGKEMRAQSARKKPARAAVAVPAAVGAAVGAGLVALGHGGAPASPPGSVPAGPVGPVTVRLFNCDDTCRALVDGGLLRQVGLGEDSGLVDVSQRLFPGSNEVVFELYNDHGPITYGFEVRVGEAIVFQETCGVVNRSGCENDRRFPNGLVRRFSYTLQR